MNNKSNITLNGELTEHSQWQDAIGEWHVCVSEMPRIVSLVPSITELLGDLGLAGYLVGRTGFCIHPHAVLQSVAKIGGTKDVNIEKIRSLKPTHIIVNIDENEKSCVDLLARFIPHVVVTHPVTPADNVTLFRLLGGIFNVREQAELLCLQLVAAQIRLHASLPDAALPQRVLYCIWKDPWMTVSADTYIAAMLKQVNWQVCGVVQDPDNKIQRYPEFVWSERLLSNIDLVLLSTEPYRFTQAHADALELKIGKPVLLVDGEMLSWYGSRAIAGFDYLCDLIKNN